jgi:hypothetical protein
VGLLENDGSSENASTCTIASLYIGSSKNIVVPQHIHYSHRWSSFVNYSLYEFAALVDKVKKNISSSTRNNDSLNPSDEKDISSGLHDDHPPNPLEEGQRKRVAHQMVPSDSQRVTNSPSLSFTLGTSLIEN